MFKPVEPRTAPPPKCHHILRGKQCPYIKICKYDHVIEQPIINENTITYYLDDRVKERNSFTVLRRTLEENNLVCIKINRRELLKSKYNLHWGVHFPKIKLHPDTLINHFPNSHELTHKYLMCDHLSNFNFLPESYVLPRDSHEFSQTINQHKLWIVKPVANGEGKNIRILTHEQVLTDTNIHQRAGRCESKTKRNIVSLYIDNPLLVNNKKVDVRLYVLLKSGHQIYLYNDGIVRSASEIYDNDLNSLENSYKHITNNTINNKKMADIINGGHDECFGSFNNKSFKNLMNELNHDPVFDLKHLVLQSINHTIYSEKYKDHVYDSGETFDQVKSKCFEVLGFDVLFDSNLKPYLLEVNSMPDLNGMGRNGSVVLGVNFSIKANMLANAMNIVFCQNGKEKEHLGDFIQVQD
ncbi:hypothetical protein AKO1_006349 [Acrasis kona]|uniref:C3H1-type domain-containing protein n=1 Tax=Acrasis kona TaxID=1008807 RepID=A0AAW2YJB3_9EUKA